MLSDVMLYFAPRLAAALFAPVDMFETLMTFLAAEVISTELFVVLLLLVSGDLVRRKKLTDGLVVLTATLGLMLTVTVLKMYFEIPRPPDPLVAVMGLGFPSGHGAGVVFFSAVVWRYLRSEWNAYAVPLSVCLLLLVLLVGYSRVFLGVHTPAQVLGGYLLGALWSVVILRLYGIQRRKV